MKVTVQLFARFREAIGADRIDVTVAGERVADLKLALASRLPELLSLIAASAVAVNGEYAANSVCLTAADEVALIPPVSGGSV